MGVRRGFGRAAVRFLVIFVNLYYRALYVNSALRKKSGWVVWVECEALLRAIGDRTSALFDAIIFVQKMSTFSVGNRKIKSFNLCAGQSWSRLRFSTGIHVPTVATRKAHSTNFSLYFNKVFFRQTADWVITRHPRTSTKLSLKWPCQAGRCHSTS